MKIIQRVLLGLLALVVLLVVFLVGSVFVDGALGSQRLEALTNTVIPGVNGGPQVRAYVAQPPGDGPFPTLIMIHEFYGLNESILGKAEALAAEGYLVIAPDTFRGSTTRWIPRAIYQVSTNPAEQVNADLDSVYVWLESQPKVDPRRIGIAGFCYGGRTSLLYSLHNNRLAATVIFYGSAVSDPAVLKNLPGPVLGIFGGADVSIPVEEVKAFETGLEQAGVPHEITIYPGQPHAFVVDMQGVRAGGAQGEAWAQMLRFLEINLKNAPVSRTGQAIAYTGPFDWGYYARLAFEHAFGGASHH